MNESTANLEPFEEGEETNERDTSGDEPLAIDLHHLDRSKYDKETWK